VEWLIGGGVMVRWQVDDGHANKSGSGWSRGQRAEGGSQNRFVIRK